MNNQGKETRVVKSTGNNQEKPWKIAAQLSPGATPKPFNFNRPGFAVTEYHYGENSTFDVETLRLFNGKITHREWLKETREGSDYVHKVAIASDPSAPFNDTNNKITVTRMDGSRRLLSEEGPFGLLRSYVYTRPNANLERVISFTGHGPSNEGIRTTTVKHISGTVIEEKVEDVKSGIVTSHWKVDPGSGVDSMFRPTLITNELTGKASTKGYNCCQVAWESDEDGRASIKQFDTLGRMVASRTGYKNPLDFGNNLDIVTSETDYHLDALGRAVQTIQKPINDQGNPIISSRVYGSADRLLISIDPGGETRYKTIYPEEGGKIELTSHPKSGEDNRHRIDYQRYDADGALRQQMTYASSQPFALQPEGGMLLRNLIYSEGEDEQGSYRETASVASPSDIRRTRTYFDYQGRTTTMVHGYGSNIAGTERFAYDAKGQRIAHVDPDGMVTRFRYNELGEQILSAVDLDVHEDEAADHIDEKVDRLSRSLTELTRGPSGQALRVSTSEVMPGTAWKLISRQESSLDGDFTKTWQNGQESSSSRLPGQKPGEWRIRQVRPDGSYQDDSYVAGQRVSSNRYAKGGAFVSGFTFAYDGHGRLWKQTDSRTGTTIRHYDKVGQLVKLSAPNPSTGSSEQGTLDTIYVYDALGQLLSTTKPSSGVVTNVYNSLGSLIKNGGHHTIDVEYGYDAHGGNKISMSTFYGAKNERAVTRWHYNERAQLAAKEDAAGKMVRYEYTAAGRLAKRTWARGVVTDYHYSPKNRSELVKVDYSDATPDVSFTYTRLGQTKYVLDGMGRTEYRYRQQYPTVLEEEVYNLKNPEDGTPLYGEVKVLSHTFDNAVANRLTGFRIGNDDKPDTDYSVSYGYDAAGRMDRVSSDGLDFRYDYVPGSTSDRLLAKYAQGVNRTEYAYEKGRDTLLTVDNFSGPQNERNSRYDYQYDADGLRSNRITQQGQNIYHDVFAYDPDTGGVISSQQFTGGKIGQGRSVKEWEERYQYDKIGNRLSYESGKGDIVKYEANRLNQYVTLSGSQNAQPTHDADGNLLGDGKRTHVWDAENRLLEVRENGQILGHYAYDHQSRRLYRRTADKREGYLYQGWNMAAVYTSAKQPTETYTWGLDLSGSIQGAGGVGGLLSAKVNREKWLYQYDGNGNVIVIFTANGRELDRLIYDAFGNTIIGGRLANNRYRFSTKLYDQESAYNYYGHRYLSAGINGRWITHDPLSERGSINLYSFVFNNANRFLDSIGLESFDVVDPTNAGVGGATMNVTATSGGLCSCNAQNGWVNIEVWTEGAGVSQASPADYSAAAVVVTGGNQVVTLPVTMHAGSIGASHAVQTPKCPLGPQTGTRQVQVTWGGIPLRKAAGNGAVLTVTISWNYECQTSPLNCPCNSGGVCSTKTPFSASITGN